jgi:hypothetical protein
MGTAYLLMEDTYRHDISVNLDVLKVTTQSPSKLELTAAETERVGLPKFIVDVALKQNLPLALRASGKGVYNQRAAARLKDILNAIKPGIYDDEKHTPMRGRVVWQRNGLWYYN